MATGYSQPHYLTDVETLQQTLGETDLRLFDTAVFLTPKSTGGYRIDSGYQNYQNEHIPGAGFIDLISDWSDTSSTLNFTLPSQTALAEAIGESGINQEHRVVLYSNGHLMWATRAWWLLHAAGHRNVSVLNGNLRAWKHAGLPMASGTHQYPKTTFSAHPVNHAFANTADVEEAIAGNVCTVNALTPELYRGDGDFYYHRRGHIPGSLNLYYDQMLDNDYFLPPSALAASLETHGLLSAKQVIAYCGGGIAATVDGFACKLMGQHKVAVYDGSMSEWVQEHDRPLTLGALP
ncbi:sulfurtransferase [bacterium]|nr:sulfurtransferase [bacterium]